ncbi:MAG: hypothetical protein E6J90_26095 [Deltaproteobacteria bacterium]|nr:MAG: hypothetical protein E6J91_49095 [Deltaproteobacteria bacterium]TMQ14954.1 MAG: hypothetical protein E6J90_26095 [Deltaproteobacteria bacterium]
MPFIEMPFIEMPFIEMPFIEMPFIEMPFIEMPFIEMPFIEMPFIEMPFIEMPFIEMPFIEMPFIEMPLSAVTASSTALVGDCGSDAQPANNIVGPINIFRRSLMLSLHPRVLERSARCSFYVVALSRNICSSRQSCFCDIA